MEQGQKSKPLNKADKDHQDVGVCGTGKHRVININPLLLTPASASKIFARSPNADPMKRKLWQQFGLGAAVTITKVEGRDNGSAEIFPNFDGDPASPRGAYCDATQIGSSENETSRASTMTTSVDDISGVSDSELTDISEVGYASGFKNFAADFTKTEKFLSEASPKNILVTAELSSVSSQGRERPPKHSGENTKPEKAKVNVKPFARRERTIEISPSLLLPVTAMPSNTSTTSTMRADIAFVSNLNRNTHSRSISASSSKTSLSDVQSLRQSLTEETDGVSSYSEQDSNQQCSISSLHTECARLAESLRLADADIAILVSSKQQLQLDLHSESEKAKTLSRMVLEAEGKNQNFVSSMEDLRKTMLEQEEKYNTELENLGSNYQRAKSELDVLQNSLDLARANRDSKKLEIEHLKWDSEESKINLARAQTELADLTRKNINLESLLREATTKDEGIETFTKHLAQEKQDISRLLQEKVNESTMLQITNKTLEAKIADLQHTKQHLSAKAEKHEALFREADAENVKLTSQLQSTRREKAELNSAVARLRSDLGKVENSFSRLKRQMIEKSNFAEQESAKRSEMEERVRSLVLQVAKLNNVNAETRIRDKNVQIEHLLTKSRTSTIEKTKREKEMDELKEHIAQNEKSWVDAVQKEKETTGLLEKQANLVAAKQSEIAELSVALSKEQRKTEEATLSLMDSEKASSHLKAKLANVESLIERLTRENASVSAVLEESRKERFAEREKAEFDARQSEAENAECRKEMQRLADEVDILQKAVISKGEEINSLESNCSTITPDDDNEQHTIRQLELLSELQNARRQLSQDKEVLTQENNRLQFAADAAEREVRKMGERIDEERKKHENAVRELEEVANSEKDDLAEKAVSLEKKLGDCSKAKLRCEEEVSMINKHNNELSQQMGALQVHNKKLTEELKQKIFENEGISSQRKTASEEMEILKQELANVTVRLTNLIQGDKKREESHLAEVGNFLKEREVLRSAVIRQQQYCTSLQKHYEDWAKEATEKMKAEMARARTAAKESYTYQKSVSEYEASPAYENQQVFDVNGDRNPRLDLVCSDGRFKTDDILLEDLKESGNEDEMRDLVTSRDESTQTDNGVSPVADCRGTGQSETTKVDITVQSDHEKQVSDLLAAEVNREMAALIEEKIQLMQENTQQAEIIAVLQSRVQDWTTHDFKNFSTQTPHDDVALPLPTDSAMRLSLLLEDASTQTDHDSEPVGHKLTSALEDLEKQRRSLEQRVQNLQSENTGLLRTIDSLKNLLEVERSHHGIMPESTQTDHDLVPIHSVAAPSCLCEEAWTQTDHNEEMLPRFGRELTNGEWEALMQENETLKAELAAALTAVQFRSCRNVTPEGTQTDHDLVPVHSIAAPSCLCEEVWTQTGHDEETLPRFGGELPRDKLVRLMQENEELKMELAAALNDLRRLKASSMLEDSGTQTSHNDEPVLQHTPPSHRLRHEVASTLLEDSTTQTERVEQAVQDICILELDSVKDELLHSKGETERLAFDLRKERSRNETLNARIEELEMSKMKDGRDVELQASSEIHCSEPRAHSANDKEEQSGTSWNQNGGTEGRDSEVFAPSSGEDRCPSCGKLRSETPSGPRLPSPMTILRTMESEKLKAYKRTVHLCKKKLKVAEERISNLQAELRILSEHQSTVIEPKTVENGESNSEKIQSLEGEMLKVKRSSALQLEKAKRKASADKKMLEAKLSNASERLSALTETNEQLRNSVEKLQVKLTEKTRQGDIALKEKNRYQMRSRRLQASLRSLAWITGNQDKSLPLSEDSLNDSFPDSVNFETFAGIDYDGAGDQGLEKNAEDDSRARLSMPASVVEIEASLKDLQSEIIALEKQMQEHNSAVCKTKSQWTRFKRESSDFTDDSTLPLPPCMVPDPLDQIAEVV